MSDVQRVEVIGRYYLHAFANSAGESVKQIVQDDANALKTRFGEVCLFEAREMEFKQVESSTRRVTLAERHVNIVLGTRNFSLSVGHRIVNYRINVPSKAHEA